MSLQRMKWLRDGSNSIKGSLTSAGVAPREYWRSSKGKTKGGRERRGEKERERTREKRGKEGREGRKERGRGRE